MLIIIAGWADFRSLWSVCFLTLALAPWTLKLCKRIAFRAVRRGFGIVPTVSAPTFEGYR